ncbi:hypothetical protein BDZ45DRAFT_434425 [Acephala macrosclerotiorum]|nr:hypothetical protein BDZ45DRAFT_434425 [Acephala macrosclerotiorum]
MTQWRTPGGIFKTFIARNVFPSKPKSACWTPRPPYCVYIRPPHIDWTQLRPVCKRKSICPPECPAIETAHGTWVELLMPSFSLSHLCQLPSCESAAPCPPTVHKRRSQVPLLHQTSPLPEDPGVQYAYAFLAGELFGPVSLSILAVRCSRSGLKNLRLF